MVRGDTLSQTVRDGADDLRLLAQTLTTKAKLAGGFDNISVVLARCEGSELPDARAEPPSVEPMKVASTPTAPPPVRRRLEIALLLAALFLMLAMAGVIILLG
ncbi:MAG: hypothetical protein CSA24_02365 [Deltaproteobacteria bacterium]|nr:MAG: hypothetical protein CSA24_02365 [Deltaproteobacteria bacterium]